MSIAAWSRVENLAADRVGGIHHDETAREKGFPAGIVGGDVLLALTVDAAMTRIGDRWFRDGWLSHVFVAPAYNGDELRVREDDDALTLERRDDTVIGTMRYGTGEPRYAPLAFDGDPLPHEPVGAVYDDKVIEPDDTWAVDGIVSTVGIFHLAHRIRPTPMPPEIAAELRAGMNSRFEGQHHAPMHVGRPYLRRASLLAKGITGRYGARTVDFSYEDADTGAVVFRGRWGIKWVRASST